MVERRKLSVLSLYLTRPSVLNMLQSIAPWVDQLVILDSGSSDGTTEICRRYTDEVHDGLARIWGPKKSRWLYVITIGC